MNTRLQVEHPVTEMVTGLDLVGLQIDEAEGRVLPVEQSDVALKGWSMEVRLYAEDPSDNFMPHSGAVHIWRPSDDARFDTGIDEGDEVTTFYDPMVAKVIVHAETRDAARQKLSAALRKTPLIGFAHNKEFLINLLEDQAFADGQADTGFIERNLDSLAQVKRAGGDAALSLLGGILTEAHFDDELTGWTSRGSAGFPVHVEDQKGEAIKAQIALSGSDIFVAANDDSKDKISIVNKSDRQINFRVNGALKQAYFHRTGDAVEIDCDGVWSRYTDLILAPSGDSSAGDDVVKTPMAGVVTGILVRKGASVSKGTTVATIEAMKMEHQLKVSRDGIVDEILAKEGDQLAIRSKVIVLEAKD